MAFDIMTFNTIVGIILALAAILVYLLQRARYLREIEPDIEITWAKKIRIGSVGSNLKDFWSYDIDVRVENLSKNHAKDMLFTVELDVFPERGGSRVLQTKFPEIPRIYPTELMAGRSTEIPIYIGLNYARGLYEQFEEWGKPISFDSCGFFTTINLEYYSSRELLLFFLIPWSFGRKKYKRKLFLSYGFELIKEKDKTYYVARKWEFPYDSLSEWDDE